MTQQWTKSGGLACLVALTFVGCGDSDVRRKSHGPRGAARALNGAVFPGGPNGTMGEPLQPGFGPNTAGDCNPVPSAAGGVNGEAPVVETTCFYSEDHEGPAAMIERVLEAVDEDTYVHLRLTMNPGFVDNTYGATAVGWEGSKKGGHTFKELVGSDHAEIKVTDGSGNLAVHFVADYLSEDDRLASGYANQGVTGGKNDGEMEVGSPAHILAATTSLDRNLNACGLSGYTEDSPPTDESYTPSPGAEEWDFRMVYDVWIDSAAFGGAGFGEASVEFVHASPSKGEDSTLDVDPGPCPPPGCVIGFDEVCREMVPVPEEPDPESVPEEPDPEPEPEPETPDPCNDDPQCEII